MLPMLTSISLEKPSVCEFCSHRGKKKKPSNKSENVYTHLHTTNTLPLTINDKFVFSFAVISISGIFASRFRAPNGDFLELQLAATEFTESNQTK